MFGLEMNSFNIDDGFAEAACRALSKSMLRNKKYDELKEATTIADFMMVLKDTDYGNYLIN